MSGVFIKCVSINIGDMVTCGGKNYAYRGIEAKEILGEKSKYAVLEGKEKGSLIIDHIMCKQSQKDLWERSEL